MRAGANAIGFVFAPSPREVTPGEAAAISNGLHPSVLRVGVFVDSSLDSLLEAVRVAGLSGVQLQGSESLEFAIAVKAANPELFVYKAVKVDTPESLGLAEAYAKAGLDAVMVDRKDVSRPGLPAGRVPQEWLKDLRIERLIVAGGLGPDGVASLVRDLHPWGVDVSGGVEEAPGRKDPLKIRAFLKSVRDAEAAA